MANDAHQQPPDGDEHEEASARDPRSASGRPNVWKKPLQKASNLLRSPPNPPGPLQITLMEMLVALALIALCLGSCVMWIRGSNVSSLEATCANNLKQIGLALNNYRDAYGCFPPDRVTDADGKATLSWRVLAAEFLRYAVDFRSGLDFSQPWDSQENQRFLQSIGHVSYRCPAARDGDASITHYVAVVGPGTLWEESLGGKQPETVQGDYRADSGPVVRAIEWPPSSIHWAEPRDVTVDEFLQWFRSPGRYRDLHHPGCLLYLSAAGEVHELPMDTDPAEVRRMLTVEPADASR